MPCEECSSSLRRATSFVDTAPLLTVDDEVNQIFTLSRPEDLGLECVVGVPRQDKPTAGCCGCSGHDAAADDADELEGADAESITAPTPEKKQGANTGTCELLQMGDTADSVSDDPAEPDEPDERPIYDAGEVIKEKPVG